MHKPKDEIEFLEWIKEQLKFDFEPSKYKFYYETVTRKIKDDFEKSDSWKNLLQNLNEFNDEYYIEKGVNLLIPSEKPQIYIKSLESVINKAYRKNVLNNINYPASPDKGWVTPDNWFENLNDILRTTITVKYLDGVSFLINKLESYFSNQGFKFDCSYEAREEGYYAAHSGIEYDFDIPDPQFSPIKKKFNIEIQVTTQIQETIKNLLHKHYEENRKKEKAKDYKWQWDYKSEEFIPNYLGHIIHYVEGMIVEIRDKK